MFFFFQIMSVYYDEEEKVDSLAEGILQRADRRVLVHNYYTYDQVAKRSNHNSNKVRGKNIIIIFLLKVVFQFI